MNLKFNTTHYSPAVNGDMLDIDVHKNVQLSEIILILWTQITYQSFPFAGSYISRKLSDLVDKFTDWKRFQSLTSELISPRIQINSGEEASKAAQNFTASIALAYRLSTKKLHS
jgi:hypothetical protein